MGAAFAAGLTWILLSYSLAETQAASEEKIEQALVNQLEQEGVRRAELLALSLSDALYQLDIRTIEVLAEAANGQNGVLAVSVFDHTAEVLHDGTAELDSVGETLELALVNQALSEARPVSKINGDTVEVTTPVVIGRRLLGGVYFKLDKQIVATELSLLRASLTRIERDSQSNRVAAIAGIVAVFSILGFWAAYYISRNMAEPIRKLTRTTSTIGKRAADAISKDLLALSSRQDEIGQLSRSLADTACELELTTVAKDHVSNLLKALPDPVFVLNKSGNIKQANPAMCEQVNWSEEMLSGRHFTDFLVCAHLDLDAVINGDVSVVAGAEGRLRATDTPVSIAAAAFEDSTTSERLVVLAVRDIAELVEAQNALIAARDEAQAANKAKSTFLANMSHELKTPMNAIIGFTELMILDREKADPDAQELEYLSIIKDNSHQLVGIINDVLDMSRVDAGTLTLEVEDTSLSEQIEAALLMLAGRAQASQINLEKDLDATLVASVDPRLFRQIAYNLISNAIKFTDPGGRVSVVLRRNRIGQPIFAVWDSGIGMRAVDVKKAMLPFEQADDRLSRKFGGTGLGLPLVAKMTAQHGGKFRLFSRIGKGTIAYVRLPAERVCHQSVIEAASNDM